MGTASSRHQGPLVRSEHLQVRHANEYVVAWNSLFGRPVVLSRRALELLERFAVPMESTRTVTTEDEKHAVEALLVHRLIRPVEVDERLLFEAQMSRRNADVSSGARVDFLELIMSEACNFRCTYCIHFNNLEQSSRIDNPIKLMSISLGRRAIDGYLRILREHEKQHAVVNFGGGEPLLVWDRVVELMQYCKDEHGDEFDFRFLLNTNCSLISLEIAAQLRDFGVEIAASLDGNQHGNDSVRLTKSGKGTFDAVVHGFDNLAAVGYPLSGFSVTLTELNFDALDETIIDWAVDRGMTEVRVDIDVIGAIALEVDDIVAKLASIRRYGESRGVSVPGFWSRPAENLGLDPLSTTVSFCGAIRGNSVCVSPSGIVYACGYSNRAIGSVDSMPSLPIPGGDYEQLVLDRAIGLDMCRGCMIEAQCGGGCEITREFDAGSSKVERMCDLYRQMTEQILLDQLALWTSEGKEVGDEEQRETGPRHRGSVASRDSPVNLSPPEQLPLIRGL